MVPSTLFAMHFFINTSAFSSLDIDACLVYVRSIPLKNLTINAIFLNQFLFLSCVNFR